eukprot:4075565-Karenia_brevis.AAC.1
MFLGDGPIGILDVERCKTRLEWLGKGQLTEDRFTEELIFVNTQSPHRSRNGMQLWSSAGHECKALHDKILLTSGTGSNVCLLVVHPSGRSLLSHP